MVLSSIYSQIHSNSHRSIKILLIFGTLPRNTKLSFLPITNVVQLNFHLKNNNIRVHCGDDTELNLLWRLRMTTWVQVSEDHLGNVLILFQNKALLTLRELLNTSYEFNKWIHGPNRHANWGSHWDEFLRGNSEVKRHTAGEQRSLWNAFKLRTLCSLREMLSWDIYARGRFSSCRSSMTSHCRGGSACSENHFVFFSLSVYWIPSVSKASGQANGINSALI